jgi:hypothetical protein
VRCFQLLSHLAAQTSAINAELAIRPLQADVKSVEAYELANCHENHGT